MISQKTTEFSDAIVNYGLAEHIHELDENGLTIVPQSTLGLPDDWFEEVLDAILRVAHDRAGVVFDLHKNPSAKFSGRPSEIGQLILSHLIHEDQVFERVVTNPVKKVLMTHLLGEEHRLAVSDAWIKWETPHTWVGEVTTDFHADQKDVPPPWNWRLPHIANMNWILTDYTRAHGALAYVPGSHRLGRHPEPGEALPLSVPVEADKGSLVIFNGCLWHGSYRKTTSGLRITLLGQHCRPYILPFEDYKGRLPKEAFLASKDPDYLRTLLREDERLMRIHPDSILVED